MPQTTHVVRNHLLADEYTLTLEDTALTMAKRKTTKQQLPYADIASVQLITFVGATGGQAQCKLRRRSRGKVLIRSHHYMSLGHFEDRRGTYGPFIRELCRRVAAANPQAQFFTGSTGLWIAWLVVAATIAFFILLIVLASLEGLSFTAKAIPAIIALLLFVPAGWKTLRGGAKKTFDPLAVPSELVDG